MTWLSREIRSRKKWVRTPKASNQAIILYQATNRVRKSDAKHPANRIISM